MRQFTYSFFQSSFRSVPEVIQHMEQLQIELKNTDLEHVRAFNKTYLIITKNVYKKIGTGYFQFDDVMTAVDINFASYYFRALKSYVEKKRTPPAWEISFDASKRNNYYQFIYMALGVNAHVNNDLAQSLHDVVKDETYKGDFNKVNAIIHESIPEVIKGLQESSSSLALLEKIFLPVYTFFLDALIQNWRSDTWNTFLALKKKIATVHQVENKAEKLAVQLSKIKRLRDIRHLRNVFM